MSPFRNQSPLFILGLGIVSFSYSSLGNARLLNATQEQKYQKLRSQHAESLTEKETLRQETLNFIHDGEAEKEKQRQQLKDLQDLRPFVTGAPHLEQRKHLEKEISKLESQIQETTTDLNYARELLQETDDEIDNLEKQYWIVKEIPKLHKESLRPKACDPNPSTDAPNLKKRLLPQTPKVTQEFLSIPEAPRPQKRARLPQESSDAVESWIKQLSQKSSPPSMVQGHPSRARFNRDFMIQNVAGDGNCYFTSFLVSVLNDPKLSKRLEKKMKKYADQDEPRSLKKAQARYALQILSQLNNGGYSSDEKIHALNDPFGVALPLIQVLRNMVYRYARNHQEAELIDGLKVKDVMNREFKMEVTQLGNFAEYAAVPLLALATGTSISVFHSTEDNQTTNEYLYPGTLKGQPSKKADVNVWLSGLHYQALLPR